MEKFKRYFNLFINYDQALLPKKNIFILSHMRSTSTLLCHILSSHEKICGHRELHSSYSGSFDILKTKSRLIMEKDSYDKSDYLLDKLLHNKLEINEDLFKAPPKYIFLLRNPERTMSSMIKMHLKDGNKEKNINTLVDYYVNRVKFISEQWNVLNGEKIYISSEDLTNKPDETLSKISNFLTLNTPISQNYSTYVDTGKGGIGDQSNNIKKGVILKSTPEDEYSRELLNKLDMEKVRKAYQDALRIIT